MIKLNTNEWKGALTMNKLGIALVAVTLTLVVLAPTANASYYLMRDRDGAQTAVTNAMPGIGWSIFAGPFKTVDEAIRAAGTGTVAHRSQKLIPDFPSIVPKLSGESFAEALP